MMSRDRKIRPAMTNGWLANDILGNLGKNPPLSRRMLRHGGN